MSLQTESSVIVIGAGPAGMMSAITAARGGLKVSLWDKNGFAGKKLNITGKGRCNITNLCDRDEFFDNVATGGKFLQSAYSRFAPQDAIDFFEGLGVRLKVERGRRVFPASDRARDVTDALVRELGRLGVKIVKRRADDLVIEDGVLAGIRSGADVFPCRAAVIATGGLSYPLTGSDGDGYRLASRAGHTITGTAPSLVPLNSPDPACARMQGLSLRNVTVTLLSETGKRLWSEGPGEMLLTHFGVSGPLILSASAFYSQGCFISIDLKPGLSEEALDARILRDFQKHSNRELGNALGDLLHKTMIPVIIERLGVSPGLRVHQVTREQRRRLLELLKSFSVELSGTRSVDEAVITRGGVATGEISPSTMESKHVKELYFAGEVLDVDALTGGFNLQIAWSTGFSAGTGLLNGYAVK